MEKFSNNAQSTLNGAITNSDLTLVVTSATNFPTTGDFRLRIDDEIMLVTAVSGATFTVTRAQEGTSAAAHSNGTMVRHVLTAGALVAVSLASGTSFPGSPSTGDLFHRTDLGIPLWRYDGTRWLCTCVHESTAQTLTNLTPITTSPIAAGRWPSYTDYNQYIDSCHLSIYVLTTNTGSAYWTLDFQWTDSADTGTSLGSTDTSADAANTWIRKKITVGAVLNANARQLRVLTTKVGAPGGHHMSALMRWRLIAP